MAGTSNKPIKNESQPSKKEAGSPGFSAAESALQGEIGLDPVAARFVMAMQSRSGPLPSGAEFASYEQTFPGAANRILSMTEKEQDARLLENKIQLIARYAVTLIGQGASIWLVYNTLGKSYDLAMHGHEGTAVAYATTSIATILGAFFGSRFMLKAKKSENEEE